MLYLNEVLYVSSRFCLFSIVVFQCLFLLNIYECTNSNTPQKHNTLANNMLIEPNKEANVGFFKDFSDEMTMFFSNMGKLSIRSLFSFSKKVIYACMKAKTPRKGCVLIKYQSMCGQRLRLPEFRHLESLVSVEIHVKVLTSTR